MIFPFIKASYRAFCAGLPLLFLLIAIFYLSLAAPIAAAGEGDAAVDSQASKNAALSSADKAKLNAELISYNSFVGLSGEQRWAEVQKLIAAGADVNAQDFYGDTLLMKLAAMKEYDRNTPARVMELLEAGADPNIRNKKGHTALLKAAHFCKSEVAKLLFTFGADINLRYTLEDDNLPPNEPKSVSNRPVFMESCQSVLNLLIEAGAAINDRDDAGNTPLIMAARHKSITPFFLESGPDLNAQNNAGRTALMYAAYVGYFTGFEDLIKAGADPNIKDKEGKTALDYIEPWKEPKINLSISV